MPEVNTQAVAICPTCKGFREPKPLQHSTIYFCQKCGHGEQVNNASPTNIMETCSPGGNCFNDEESIPLATEDPELIDMLRKALEVEDDGPNILQPLHDPMGASIYRQKIREDEGPNILPRLHARAIDPETGKEVIVDGGSPWPSIMSGMDKTYEGDIPLWMQLTPQTYSGKTHHDPSQVEDKYASAKKAGIDIPNIFSSWPDESRNVIEDLNKVRERIEYRPNLDFFKSGIPLQVRNLHGFNGAPMTEQMKQHHTGAVRSSDADNVAYHLISPVGLRRIAETYAEGSKKYGDYNWEKGFNVGETLNHTVRHIYMFLDGDKSEDHLAHAAWNLIAVMHFQERMPHLLQDLRPAAIEAATPKDSFQESVASPSNWDIAEEIQNGLRRGDSIVAPVSPPVFDQDLQPGMLRTDNINKIMTINVPPGFTVAIGDLRIKDRVVYSTNNPTLKVHAETHIDIPKAGS